VQAHGWVAPPPLLHALATDLSLHVIVHRIRHDARPCGTFSIAAVAKGRRHMRQ
jgi:hypothetical protein